MLSNGYTLLIELREHLRTMHQPRQQEIGHRRVPGCSTPVEVERRVLREVFEYQGDRQIIGRTLLEVPALSRQAHLWSFDDGEHVLMLVELQRYRYWVASRDSLERLRDQACEWLTEPRSA